MSRPPSRRLLLRKKEPQANFAPLNVPGVSHKFDEATGQIYTETTISIQSGDDSNWARKPHFHSVQRSRQLSLVRKRLKKRKDSKNPSNENSPMAGTSKGARPLHDIAIDITIQNLDETSLGVLECVPFPMVERIWEAMNKMCPISLEIWKMFSKLLKHVETKSPSLLRYADVISYPRSPLDTYIQPLVSHSFDFLTCLSITTHFPIPDLVKLSKVRNLGILEITSTSPTLLSCTDSVIRAWSIAATEEAAFLVLRTLRLFNHKDVTNKSLLYLNSFPALAVFEVGDCGFNRSAQVEARAVGWKPTIDSVLTQLESICIERLEPLRASFGIDKPTTPSFSSEKESTDMWEHNSCRLFDRIGELRNDSDLKRAGIVVGTSVSIDHESASSMPLCLVGLGPRSSPKPKSSLSFLRISLESPHSNPPTNQTNTTREQVKVVKSSHSEKSGRSAVPKSKKRKLGDLLNSFI